jgi:N-acetylglucosamine-6-phosphate deacetylase
LHANLQVLEEARRLDIRLAHAVPCYHIEGPYLSPGPSHGAHDPALMHAPDWNEFTRLQAVGNRIGIVTLAPEWLGALDFIRRARAAGILVGLSHTDGSPEDVHQAAAAGATLAAHLGNGCPEFLHRHHAPFWAQLADDRLDASLICDGFHLTPDIVQIAVRVKGLDRVMLITDAVHVAGLPPGRNMLVGVPIELELSGRVARLHSNSMAGSSLTMNRAVAVFMEVAAVSLADAVLAATRNPAKFLGREGVCVELSPGQPANLILFRPGPGSLEIESVWVRGERVSQEIGSSGS